MKVILNAAERAELFKQDPATKGDGGFQSLLVGLQQRLDPIDNSLALFAADLDRIPAYAFDYQNGGWQTRLKAIFARHLGPKLGRP